MRKVSGPLPAGPLKRAVGTNRRLGATAKKVGGSGGLIVLSILFWYIFYQNLPGNFGMNELASEGPRMMSESSAVGSGNTLDRIMKVCMIAMSFYVIASRWSVARLLAKNINIGATAVLLLAALSAMWSIDRDATILRCITLASIVLMCFALTLAGWHPQRFQQLTLPPLMCILILSLVIGIFSPESMIEIGNDISLKNSWHGITITKNQFGMTASLGVIICVNRWLAREGRKFWHVAGTIVAFTCLILSRSNTSLFATLLSILFMVLAMRVPVIRQRFTSLVAITIASTLLLYELVIQNVIPGAYTLLAPIRGLTGKDATFSARTNIWDIIKEHIQAAPNLGTGYGAYWVGPVATSPSYVFTYKMYFYPTEAHNGYLDIVNDLGYVGLICVLAFIFFYMRQALQLMRFDRNQSALYLALLFQQMVMNMSESEWFARDSISTILILATACLSRSLLEGRLQAQSVAPTGR